MPRINNLFAFEWTPSRPPAPDEELVELAEESGGMMYYAPLKQKFYFLENTCNPETDQTNWLQGVFSTPGLLYDNRPLPTDSK